jgi:hypothetical protein
MASYKERKAATRAAHLYANFREQGPARLARRVAFKIPKAVAVLGHVEFIGYATTRAGKTELYIHEFAPGSRPRLAAGAGRNQVVLIGGRYRMTSRGIVDLDSRGREVKCFKSRYKVLTR